jgi:hypothetical protein
MPSKAATQNMYHWVSLATRQFYRSNARYQRPVINFISKDKPVGMIGVHSHDAAAIHQQVEASRADGAGCGSNTLYRFMCTRRTPRSGLCRPGGQVACDTDRIEIRTAWTNTVPRTYEIKLEDIGDPRNLELLHNVFSISKSCVPSGRVRQLRAKQPINFHPLRSTCRGVAVKKRLRIS